MEEDNKKKKRVITIQATPEMANWMHPQTPERKALIKKKVEEAKKRFLESRKKEEEEKE